MTADVVGLALALLIVASAFVLSLAGAIPIEAQLVALPVAIVVQTVCFALGRK